MKKLFFFTTFGIYTIISILGISACSKNNSSAKNNYICKCTLNLNNLIIDSTKKNYFNLTQGDATDSCTAFTPKAFHGAASTIGTTICGL